MEKKDVEWRIQEVSHNRRGKLYERKRRWYQEKVFQKKKEMFKRYNDCERMEERRKSYIAGEVNYVREKEDGTRRK